MIALGIAVSAFAYLLVALFLGLGIAREAAGHPVLEDRSKALVAWQLLLISLAWPALLLTVLWSMWKDDDAQ